MNITRFATPLLMSTLVLGLVACGDATTEPASQPSTAPSDSPAGGSTALDGRTYLSTGATGYTIVDGTVIRINFDGDRIGVNAGCNSMGGSYEITDGTLVVGEMMMTQMACEQALMDQDTAISAFLATSPTITADGDTLTLSNGTITLEMLDREVADPDRPLAGTEWTVDTVISGGGASSGWGEATASIVFTIDGTTGKAAVNAGCNRGAADVTVGEGTITFGPLALTKMMCDEAAMELEAAVVSTLTGETTYTIEADVLTIMNGTQGLGLRAAE
jgi:heat shock protein HslJ